MSAGSKAAMARSAMAALEPLVEMLLEMGVTSPEAESLLRSVFVHRARAWLTRLDPDGTEPSDARIALVTGVHRNFVRHILAEPPRIAKTRQQKGSHAGRLLDAWHSDPLYISADGKPLELPERGDTPSFQMLVSTHLPGTSAGVLLEELRRGGQVQTLPDNRVRVRSRVARARGLTMETAAEIGERTRELVETMRHNLRRPEEHRPFESMSEVDLDEASLAGARELIARRTLTFLTRLQQELTDQAGSTRRNPSKRRVRVGVSLYATERTDDK
jgi:Family of unknown function (DUF6502)